MLPYPHDTFLAPDAMTLSIGTNKVVSSGPDLALTHFRASFTVLNIVFVSAPTKRIPHDFRFTPLH